MSFYLGFDTSNYTTSVALYDSDRNRMYSARKLLEVKAGALGLRQSDALFGHTVQLSDLVKSLTPPLKDHSISAVAASVRPREADGSYMPCFLAGKSHAETVATLLGVPFYAFSHQQGHIAAGAWSAEKSVLLQNEFIALHVSGGTTEILHVIPSDKEILSASRIGGSTDLAAGQLVDRCGQMLGLSFPAGPELELLAFGHTAELSFVPRSIDLEFSLSGLENKIKSMRTIGQNVSTEAGKENASNIAYFVIKSIMEVLSIALERAIKRYPGLPILCVGGVMSNSMIQDVLHNRFGAVFSLPEYSSDNAAGIAYLAAVSCAKGEKTNAAR